MKKILVTGGLGYIGSHTVVELVNHGYEPVIVDDLSNTSLNMLEGIKSITGQDIPFFKEDVRNIDAMSTILKDNNIQAVIHFAAFKAVGESVQEPLKYYDNNIGGLVNLLKAMKAAHVKNIVFSSSCTVYGEPDVSPVNEQSPIKKANSPYGNTKQIGEEILADCQFLNTVALRYFNPIGAHASAQIGELPLGVPNNLIPYITQTAAGIREKLTVFGSDYNTKDGTCIRDYIHVTDLAIAHVKSLDYIEKHPDNQFEIFNIGTGNGLTVLEIIQAFENVNQLKLNYSIGPRRAGDVEKVWADASKAKQILGWTAHLDLNEMVRSAWAWQQNLK
ncbi:MAG: UDP-glucose 4-epimerase GalE [Bacteroidetes bacterium]|nr:UDP-glucose 4-epimerase GalE [Bacteroidota bacterium]